MIKYVDTSKFQQKNLRKAIKGLYRARYRLLRVMEIETRQENPSELGLTFIPQTVAKLIALCNELEVEIVKLAGIKEVHIDPEEEDPAKIIEEATKRPLDKPWTIG